MSERLAPMTYDELEARLADLAPVLAFPPTPDLASAVGGRLRTSAVAIEPRWGRLPFRRSIRTGRSARRSLLLAAALALLVVGAAFAVRFGLELLSIDFGPVATEPVPTEVPASHAPATLGARLGLGDRLDLEQLAADASFEVLVPEALGKPDAVYLGGVRLRGQVAFVYVPRDGVPPSELLHGAGLLVTQNRGEPDQGLAHKLASAGLATVEQVIVDGAPGVWISGQPHIFWYIAPDGTYIEESRRVVGDTLAWERDGILYRIEGAIPLEQALEIARSMR